MSFQTAFIINLDDEQERLEASEAQLARAGLHCQRFNALRYSEIPEHLRGRFSPPEKTVLTENETACFASHLALIERISMYEDGFFAICEDDLEFIADQGDVEQIIRHLNDDIQWDLVRPNLFPKGPSLVREKVGRYRLVDFFIPPVKAEFYFIRPEGAKKLLSEAWDINMPFDVFVKDLSRWKIDAPGIIPPLTRQRRVKSTIDPSRMRYKSRRNDHYSYLKSAVSPSKEIAFVRKFGPSNAARLLFWYGIMYSKGLKRDRDMKYVLKPL